MTQVSNQVPIFCVNLQRATERKQLIQELWINKLGFNITFWNAYDRRNVQNGQLLYPYNAENAKYKIGRELSLGEIACATSFITLYEHIISNDIQEAIIMEDDIVPTIINQNQLYDAINQGKFEFPQAEMILLHQLPSYLTNNAESYEKIYNIKKHFFSQCQSAPWGNQLFYITNKAVRVLLKELVPIEIAADYPQDMLARQGKLIIANNPLCTHDWSTEGQTYIGNDYRNSRRIFIP